MIKVVPEEEIVKYLAEHPNVGEDFVYLQKRIDKVKGHYKVSVCTLVIDISDTVKGGECVGF